jgi:hypothetical protein
MRVALLVILAAALVGTAAGALQLAPARIAARIVTGTGRRAAEGRLRPEQPRDRGGRHRVRPEPRRGHRQPDRPRLEQGRRTSKVGPAPFTAALAFGDVWVPTSYATSVVRIRVG